MKKQFLGLVVVLLSFASQSAFAQVWEPRELGNKSLEVTGCKLAVNKGVLVQTFWGLKPGYGVPVMAPLALVDNQYVGQFAGFSVSVQIAPNLGQDHLDLVDFSQKVKPTFRAHLWNDQGKLLKSADGFINYAHDYIPNQYLARNSGLVGGGWFSNKNELELLNKKDKTAILFQVQCDVIAK